MRERAVNKSYRCPYGTAQLLIDGGAHVLITGGAVAAGLHAGVREFRFAVEPITRRQGPRRQRRAALAPPHAFLAVGPAC